jgi:YVTN family beta-propeller protein
MTRTNLCLATALILLACSNGTDSTPVASLQVSPNPIVLQRGDSVQLNVSAVDAQGHLVTGVAVTFQTGDAAIVTVSPLGVVKTVQKGATTITVSGGGVSTHVPVTIAVPVAGVRVTPINPTVRARATVQLSATLVDIDGDPVTPQPTFQYSSNDSTIVAVNASGLARSVGPVGSAAISAQGGGSSGFTVVTVIDSSIIARQYISGSPQFVAAFGNTAYVARPFDNKVEVLSLTTDRFVDSIAVGSLPCGVVFNRAGTKAYVANQFSDNVSIIDVVTRIQTGTIAVHGDPLPVAMPAGDTVLFVTTNADKLFKINLRNNTVVDSLPLPATSHHMLVHPNDTLLYVATRDAGTVLEVNWRTMTIARTFTLGVQTLGMEIAPDRSELYVTSGSTSFLYIVTLSGGAIASAPVGAGASTIVLSADGTKLYVGLLFAGQVDVLNRTTRARVKTITTGGVVRDMATDAPRNRVIVTNEGGWVDIMR